MVETTEKSNGLFYGFAKALYVFAGLWYIFMRNSATLTPSNKLVWLILSVIGAAMCYERFKNGFFQKNELGSLAMRYCLFMALCAVTILYSYSVKSTKTYITTLFSGLVFGMAIIGDEKSCKYFINMSSCFLLFLMAVSLIEYFFPSVYKANFLPLINNNDTYRFRMGVDESFLRGFTVGTSQNGLWMAIGYVLFLAKALAKKKGRILNIVIAVIFFACTFATGKRSYSIITVILTFWCVFVAVRDKNTISRFLKSVILLTVIAVGLYYLREKTQLLDNILKKTTDLSKTSDMTNGRIDIYKAALNVFQWHMFFGIGADATQAVLGIDVHNSYLQMLVEYGIIGSVIPFYAIFVISFKNIASLKKIYKTINNDYDRSALLFCTLFQLLFVTSALVAIPVQWVYILTLHFVFQGTFLMIKNKYLKN